MKTILFYVFLFKCVVSSTVKTAISSAECNYCLSKSCTPTILPSSNFNAREDMKQLLAAVQSRGFAENTIIDILTSRSDFQRLQVSEEYITTGRSLTDDIKKGTHGETLGILEALTKPLQLFFVEEIYDALRSDDHEALSEIFGSLPSCAIREISVYYRVVYKISLSDDIAAHQWLNYKSFLQELAKGDRDENDDIDDYLAQKDAQELVSSILKTWDWGAKVSSFTRVFTKMSFPQLKATLDYYDTLRKKDDIKYKSIIVDVQSRFTGKLQYGLLVIIRNVLNQYDYFARELEVGLVAFALELDKRKVIRIIRSRCEVDLEDIKRVYQEKYHTTLSERIERNTGEHFSKGLNAVIKE